jgi:hypothetical protein
MIRMGDRPGSGNTSIYFDMRIGVIRVETVTIQISKN